MRTLSGMKQWIKAVRGPSAGSPSSCAATTTMWPNSGETFLYVGASQKHAWIHLSVLYFILTVPHSTVRMWYLISFLSLLLKSYQITVILSSLRQTLVSLPSHNISWFVIQVYIHVSVLQVIFIYFYSFLPTQLISMCSFLPKRLHCTYSIFHFLYSVKH